MSDPTKCPFCGGPARVVVADKRPMATLSFRQLGENGGRAPDATASAQPCYCEGARAAAQKSRGLATTIPTLKELIAAMPADERAELMAELTYDVKVIVPDELAKSKSVQKWASLVEDRIREEIAKGRERMLAPNPILADALLPSPVCPECVAGRPPHPETQREPDLRRDVIDAAELLRRFEGKPWCTRHRCELVAMSVDDFTAATVERFRAYHQEHPSWGVLHVALDDGNLDDDCVDTCVAFAREERDVEGLSLALILKGMNVGQREYLERVLDEPEKH